MHPFRIFLLWHVALAFSTAADTPTARGNFTPEQVEFFQQAVEPIMAEHCFKCHGGGPAESDGTVKIKSGLQLISRLGILRGGEHGPAFNAEKPEDSLLLRVIGYDDEHLKMPPRGRLSADELSIMEQWVKMGLPWTPGEEDRLIKPSGDAHKSDGPDNSWTYEPVRPQPPPIVEGAPHPIDAFLTKSLTEKGLRLSPAAAPETLIRRAYYDLTGLAPTPAEVGEFTRASASDPQAFSKLVDRLLSSPHYGEKYARHWLDVVRYAETNGFERDGSKEYIWKYRDYVIDSFNDDKPYDQFVREQIAGDEMEDASAESLIATGYWRLMQWDDEPADRLQHTYDVLDDNVKTTGEVFLGATLGCARCHNHKTDPISQKDYYSFMAFIHGVTPFSMDQVIRDVSAPELTIERKPSKRGEAKRKAEAQLAAMEKLARERLAVKKIKPAETEQTILVADSRAEGQTWWATTAQPPQDWAMPGFDPEKNGWKEAKGGFGRVGTPGALARTEWKSAHIWLRKYFQLTSIPKSLRLVIHHDEDAKIYLNGQLVKSFEGYRTDYTTLELGEESLKALQTGKNVLAIECAQNGGGQYVDAGLSTGGVAIGDLIREHGSEIFSEAEMKTYQDLLQKRVGGKASDPASPQSTTLAMIVQEGGPQAPQLQVHVRGNPHSPGDKVEPLFPAVFKATAPVITPRAHSSGRRLALAEWLADKENPRTARVIVNRLWQWHFGRGLTASVSDFGKLGAPCSHPELLDWLAAELVRQNWSLKAMHRLIMNSAAYRQASEAGVPQDLTTKARSVDPANALWWKFEMRRLSAEEVRDSILLVSGNLNRQMGGESFFAEMPPEVLATASQGAGAWGKSPPDQLTRRSIYMKLKRSLRHPLMADFDQADSDSSCPTRFSTTVPTQALNLLNSKFLNDQAKIFAARLKSEGGADLAACIRLGIALATQRPATAEEVGRLSQLHQEMQEKYKATQETALERVCLAILNLNEFLFID